MSIIIYALVHNRIIKSVSNSSYRDHTVSYALSIRMAGVVGKVYMDVLKNGLCVHFDHCHIVLSSFTRIGNTLKPHLVVLIKKLDAL